MDDIQKIIKNVIQKISSQNPQGSGNIQNIWVEVVDEDIRRHTQITSLRDDVLYVNVDSPAWLYQLNLKKTQLLRSIQAQHPSIKNIFFSIGKVR